MKNSMNESILKLFSAKSSDLTLQQIYDEIKDDFPDKDSDKLKHSIRRSIQSLCSKNSITRIGQGQYSSES